MECINKMNLEFTSISENEAFARTAVAAFISALDPTVEELTEIKTALSEAVSNAIIHAYEPGEGTVLIECGYSADREVLIKIVDHGKGIEDLHKAMEPLYTSKPEEERSGMGFTVMESFMDQLEATSDLGTGTSITMMKKLDMAYEL